jgi:hypothetical protein
MYKLNENTKKYLKENKEHFHKMHFINIEDEVNKIIEELNNKK